MKRGKREKKKNSVLQSYILSMLSMVLCCAMFMSATMAWFTSEVTTTGNQIYVGTLDVDLRDATNTTLHGTTATLFDTVLLQTPTTSGDIETVKVNYWQDGAIAIEPLQVVNEGDLGFRYELSLVLSLDTTEEPDLSSISAITDQFEVYVLPDDWPDSTDFYIDVTEEESGWTKVVAETTGTDADGNSTEVTLDTLTAILETGTPLFSGVITADEIMADKTSGVETAHKYTIAIRMKSDAEATYILVDETGSETTISIMGKTLTLGAKLVAHQLTDTQASVQTAVDEAVAEQDGTATIDANS